MARNGVTSLGMRRARRLLDDLTQQPFVALVFDEDGEVRIYAKGLSDEQLSEVTMLTDELSIA